MCNCEDRPACGHDQTPESDEGGYEPLDMEDRWGERDEQGNLMVPESEGDDFDSPFDDDRMTDAEADADTLKSAGWGTDEDCGGGYFDE